MPHTTQTRHPIRDITLTFTEEDHSYVDSRGLSYRSVTSLIKSAFPAFDSTAHAVRIARDNGVHPDEVIARWAAKASAASTYGTRCHEVAEALLTDRVPHEPCDGKEVVAFACIEAAVSRLRCFELVGCEIVLFDPDLLIAGTTDLVMRTPDRVMIIDWKTNEEITTRAWNTGIGGLPNCAATHYALQMSVYEEVMRRNGYIGDEPCDHALIWIPPFSTCPKWMPMQHTPEARNLLGINDLEQGPRRSAFCN